MTVNSALAALIAAINHNDKRKVHQLPFRDLTIPP